MKVFKQIVKEFWIQFILSIGWAFYSIQKSPADANVSIEFIIHFGASLFLTSWFIGQIVRIKKQQKIERNFENVENRLNTVVNRLEETTQEIINYMSGGDSFIFVQITNINATNSLGSLIILHEGKYPVYDIEIRVADINSPKPLEGARTMNSDYFQKFLFRENIAHSKLAIMRSDLTVQLDKSKPIKWNIFYTTRNGYFTQLYRANFVDNKWLHANRVMKDGKVLYEKIDDNFPVQDITKLFD